ncbi:MAG: TonB-dependent receptor [Motiliproteus sp.]
MSLLSRYCSGLKLPFLLLTGLWFPTFAVIADELMTEDDLLGSIQTVTNATRLEQQINELPVAVTVIDRWMIESSGAVNVVDLFKLVPGFQAYHINANKFGLTSHGQGDDYPGRLEVTVDGRSVYLPVFSSVDWSMLGVGIDDIDHIEVVRGPSVASHGSNAFLGAIHIITRSPLQDSGTGVGVTGGALQTRELRFRHNDQLGGLSYRMSFNYHQNEGSGFGVDRDDAANRGDLQDGAKIGQLNFSGLYTPSLQDSLSFQLGLGEGWVGVGNANDPSSFRRRDSQNNYQLLSWIRELDQGQFKVQGYRNYQDYENHDYVLASDFILNELEPDGVSDVSDALSLIGAADQLLDIGLETGTVERRDLELQYSRDYGSALRAVAGLGVREDRVQGYALLGHDDQIAEQYYRAFGTIEWRPTASVVTNLGAMFEQNQQIGGHLSPRLGLNWHAAPGHTIRASSALAYRTPSILEQNNLETLRVPSTGERLSVGFHAPDQLNPEKIRAYELGYMMEAQQLHSVFDARLFVEYIDDAIAEAWIQPEEVAVSSLVPQSALQAQNNAHWKTKGAEFQWRLEPLAGSRLFVTYAYADVTGEYDRKQYGGEVENVNPLGPRTPQHQFNILASQHLGDGLEASIAFYRQTSVKWHRGDSLKPYNRVDGRIAKRFGYGRVTGRVELILQSFNAPYTEFEINNTVDSRGFVRLTFDFL